MKIDFLKALECHNYSKCPPIWELEFHLWNKFGVGKFVVGTDFMKLTDKQKDVVIYRNAETVARVSEMLCFSAVTLPGGYWEVAPGEPAYYFLPETHRLAQAKVIKEMIGNDVALVVSTGGVMAMPEGDDYVDFSIQMMTDADSIDEMARQKLDNAKIEIDKYSDIGIDVALTASDIADSHSLYFSPEQLDRYVYPYLGEWNQYAKSKGMKSIMHTDGNINKALDKIAASGVNGIQALDSTADMDIVAVQRKYENKVCVCGNIDCGKVLLSSPITVYEDTKRLLLEIGESPNFVIGASNALEHQAPIENYKAIVEAVQNIKRN
ncbi:MAG: uroporphyrinogen decarboxylase family protein [Muribaculaceae bacterium]|nr:uroporphyrinogen decarboxylase family protein [Muribaculaceae bacterium]